jgi:SAM-dependent methyltransferase
MLSCPCCGNRRWRRVYNIDKWGIEECSACGFARIDPIPSVNDRSGLYSEEIVVERNTKRLAPSQIFSRAMKSFFKKLTKRDKNRMFIKKLFHCVPPGSKILDIGCGDGSFTKQVSGRYDCTGLEISEYLAGAAKRNGLRTMTGNFLKTDFGGEKYDGITLISLLEHLGDPGLALKKCSGLLNRAGALFIKTVNYGSLNRIVRRGGWTGFRPPDHVVYFKPSNLRRLLEKEGFKKIKIASWPFNDNMYCDAWK